MTNSLPANSASGVTASNAFRAEAMGGKRGGWMSTWNDASGAGRRISSLVREVGIAADEDSTVFLGEPDDRTILGAGRDPPGIVAQSAKHPDKPDVHVFVNEKPHAGRSGR